MKLNPAFQRLALVTGLEAIERLERTRVIVAGIGGVGSWAAEALVRSGVGHITIIDSDMVCVTNINRQVEATVNTVGQIKTTVLEARLKEINPACEITVFPKVFLMLPGGVTETAAAFGIDRADYVIDAIDGITAKLDLIETAAAAKAVLFSCMGMAQKLDPARIKTADIWETKACPLARLVRAGLKKRGYGDGGRPCHFTAVYSDEAAEAAEDARAVCGTENCFCANKDTEWCSSKKAINGSAVTVTATAGMVLASLVLQDVAHGK